MGGLVATRLRKLYTVGYEGRTLNDFLALLLAQGITRVIDVRALPLSRRRGFSKTSLREALERTGIDYVHIREAGNPYRNLKHDIVACLSAYRKHLSKTPEIIELVEQAALGHRAALLCVENEASNCHRSILGEQLRHTRQVSITDL